MVWAEPEGRGYAWNTLTLGARGQPKADPLRIGSAPAGLGLVALRGAADGGYLLLWTHGDEEREFVVAARLGQGGELSGAPVEVGSADSVLWVESVALPRATVVLWAERGGGRATLRARVLDLAGRPQGDPVVLLDSLLAWQAVRVPEGVAIAGVQRGADPDRGKVVVRYLDRVGAPAQDPVVVSDSPTARPDVDAVAVPGGLLVAWTDLRDGDPAVFMAGLDATAALVRPPARATHGLGAEAFVRLVGSSSGKSQPYLVWEALGERPDEGRSLRAAGVDGRWKLAGQYASIAVASSEELPEFTATDRGLQALTLAAPCPTEGTCDGSSAGPFFVALDTQLAPQAAEPLRLSTGGQRVTAAWDLSCTKQDCVALVAAEGSPTPVFAVELGVTGGQWRSPAQQLEPPRRPFPTSLHVVQRTDPLSDLAVARVGNETLVTWLTYFDPTLPYERPDQPAPDGRWAPVRAQLWTSRLSGGELTRPTNISYRARSLGGVALAPAPDRAEALLAWSALDQNRPQVFLTLLGERGQREDQKMFTSSAGEVSDVAAATVSDGWIVGWVDERHGDPEVYVAKVERSLLRKGEEQRVTDATGVATGLQLISSGDDEVLAVWADARDQAHPGWADIYAARVGAQDGKLVAEPKRLASSRGHSHSPALARLGSTVIVAWIDVPADQEQGAAGVSVAQLEAGARFRSPPARLSTDGVPTSLALDCDAKRCHVVAALDTGSQSALAALTWEPRDAGTPRRLRALPGASGQPVPAVLFGDLLLYADQPEREAGRLSLMGIDW